jgi:hypothetical protein
MKNQTSTVAVLQLQRGTHTKNIQLLRDAIDEAADVGDTDAIKSLNADIAATKSLIDSLDRRIAKASIAETEAEKDARRQANTEAVASLAGALHRDIELVGAVEAAIQQLAAAVGAIRENGKAGRDSASLIVRQVGDFDQKLRLSPLVRSVEHADGLLNAHIEDQFRRIGLFDMLGVKAVKLARHDLQGFAAGYQRRAEKLTAAFGKLADNLNASI